MRGLSMFKKASVKSVGYRFWKRVDKTGTCWLWKGVPRADGYGRLRVDGKQWTAHRYSYFLHNGPIAEQLCVCHSCDTPLCVNPDHLWLGDNITNTVDMIIKKRHAFGTRNGRAKLTESQVQTIRRMWHTATDKWGLKSALARQYGVSWSCIAFILNNRN